MSNDASQLTNEPGQGEWRGDFTRDTFDPSKHFLRVLMQQGRVTLDADFNEQTAILLHYLRTLARDLIGPGAAPAETEGGFRIELVPQGQNLSIEAGRYYVNGLLVENEATCVYAPPSSTLPVQPDCEVPTSDTLLNALRNPSQVDGSFLLYLDVWERHLTAVEDPSIRETALGVGGADTCTRSKVIWQVKAVRWVPGPKEVKIEHDIGTRLTELDKQKDTLGKEPLSAGTTAAAVVDFNGRIAAIATEILDLRNEQQVQVARAIIRKMRERQASPKLAARVDPGSQVENVCAASPSAAYRGVENHLYRVEIHRPGKAPSQGGTTEPPTFKWSRDNGSVVTAWLATNGNAIEVANARGFHAGHWVELSDDQLELKGQPGRLLRIAKVEGNTLTLAFDKDEQMPTRAGDGQHPKARRWDHCQSEKTTLADDHAVPITEETSESPNWIGLEDGIQIAFQEGGEYGTGDYWLIPARVSTHAIEWPTEENDAEKRRPQFLPPHGVEHHYAPLAKVEFGGGTTRSVQVEDLRCIFTTLSSPATQERSVRRTSLPGDEGVRAIGVPPKAKPAAPVRTPKPQPKKQP